VVGGGSSMDACSWTPPAAKMRITRKATAADPSGAGKKPRRRAHQAAGYDADINMSGQPNLGVIRVCSDCNTTKTPLWRSGPCGPKVSFSVCCCLFQSNSYVHGVVVLACCIYTYVVIYIIASP
jgi:hypothetical protein